LEVYGKYKSKADGRSCSSEVKPHGPVQTVRLAIAKGDRSDRVMHLSQVALAPPSALDVMTGNKQAWGDHLE
jgi:thiamine pyrophosphokinase